MTAVIDLALDNLLSPAAVANPYPIYARLRETDPVHWNPLIQMWMLTRYEDVAHLLQDPRLIGGWAQDRPFSRELNEQERADWYYLLEMLSLMLPAMDGTPHTRMRTLVHKAFTPRVIEELRDSIQTLVDQLINSAIAKGSLQIHSDFSRPLALQTIFALFDVPTEGQALIQRSTEAQIEATALMEPQSDQLARLAATVREGEQWLNAFINSHRANPSDNLIGRLVTVEENGELLNTKELTVFLLTLLSAGFETTGNLIPNGLLSLLKNPDQVALLREQPDLIESAVEEMLRYEPSVMNLFRVNVAEIAVGNTTIPPFQRVLLSLGASNRDPAIFPDPDRFDITRKPNRHLSFGYGPHYCLGAPLGRLEARIAITTLLQRLPSLRLADENATWQPNLVVRSQSELTLAFDL